MAELVATVANQPLGGRASRIDPMARCSDAWRKPGRAGGIEKVTVSFGPLIRQGRGGNEQVLAHSVGGCKPLRLPIVPHLATDLERHGGDEGGAQKRDQSKERVPNFHMTRCVAPGRGVPNGLPLT
jgi:hypothetical protein